MLRGLALVGAKNAGRVAWVGMAMFAALALGAPLGTALYSAGGFAAVAIAATLMRLLTVLLGARCWRRPSSHGSKSTIIRSCSNWHDARSASPASHNLVKKDLASGRLVRVLPGYKCVYPDGELPGLWVLYPNRRVLHRTRLLIDFLTTNLRAQR